VERLERLIDEEIARIAREGVTAEELEGAKNRYRASTIFGRQSVMGRAEALQWHNHFLGDPASDPDRDGADMAVTADDIRRVAGQYLTPQNRAVIVTQPAAAGAATRNERHEYPYARNTDPGRRRADRRGRACGGATTGAAPTRALPAPLAERPIQFPGFHEATLPNGMQLVVVEHTAQPVASVNLFIRSGATMEPARQAGLAGLTAELLTKGTATRNAVQIAETIERVGGSLNASAGDDW
jgi:zinc protease